MSSAAILAARRGGVPTATPTFTVSADNNVVSGPQGSTRTITYTITRLNGFSETIVPTATGLPTGVTVQSWSDSSLSGGDTTTTLTLALAADAPPVGADAFSAVFTATSVTQTDNGTVTVTEAASGDTDWEIERNFNSGTNLASVQGEADGLDDIAGGSKYTDEQVYEGDLACKMSIASGVEGFGNWGGAIVHPDVPKGKDHWTDLMIWMPANPTFIIDTPGNGSLKFIRNKMRTAGGGNAGYFDNQFIDDDITSNEFRFIKESTDEDWIYYGANGALPRGQWVRFTQCIHLDNVSTGSGGSPRVRVWVDGALVVNSTARRTLTNATDVCDGLYLFTYWNGNSPQAQSLYVDRIRLAAGGTPSWALDLEGVS